MADWDEFVRVHGPPAYATAWRILGHSQDCEDVLQEVFVEAYGLYANGRVRNWPAMLRRMVTFRSLDSLRRRRPSESLDASVIADASPDPESVAIGQEDDDQLRSIVSQLPSRQAAVFFLHFFDELSHEEIATAMQISCNAVALALHKARISLRDALSKQTQE